MSQKTEYFNKSTKKLWVTSIEAKCVKTGEMHKFMGPYVPGFSFEDAEKYCQANGLGYCRVVGEFIKETPFIDKESLN
jgi:hypothetical protein